jgi:GMP synthase-like glutamine amidotransferase
VSGLLDASCRRPTLTGVGDRSGSLDVLMHVAFEGPGAIAARATDRGMTVRTHQLFDGDELPSLGEVERLVVMGGPMGALDDADHPWLAGVRSLLDAAVDAGTPVLGICLGAQLLAAAGGAAVYPGPKPEIGAGRVTLADAAADDPLFGVVQGRRLDVFHWHGDTFDLPAGAVRLAANDRYANQAFRLVHAWGLQFHIELSAPDAARVTAHLGEGRSVSAAALATIEQTGGAIIEAFLDFTP